MVWCKVLTTITAKSNSIANNLVPNSVYPDLSQPGMLVSGLDDFNSTPIKINKEQLDYFYESPNVNIDLTQFKAQVQFFNNSNRPIDPPQNISSDWNAYMKQIERTTALIKFVHPDGTIIERRIAARDPEIPSENLSKPDISLESALSLINVRRDLTNTYWIAGDPIHGYGATSFSISVDTQTMNEFNVQTAQMKQPDWGKVMLRAGMNIVFYVSGIVHDNYTNETSLCGGRDCYTYLRSLDEMHNVTLKNKYTKLVIGSDSIAEQSILYSDLYQGKNTSRWDIVPIGKDTIGNQLVKIVATGTNMAMENQFNSVKLYTYEGHPDQKWRILQGSNGDYMFDNMANDKIGEYFLDIETCSHVSPDITPDAMSVGTNRYNASACSQNGGSQTWVIADADKTSLDKLPDFANSQSNNVYQYIVLKNVYTNRTAEAALPTKDGSGVGQTLFNGRIGNTFNLYAEFKNGSTSFKISPYTTNPLYFGNHPEGFMAIWDSANSASSFKIGSWYVFRDKDGKYSFKSTIADKYIALQSCDNWTYLLETNVNPSCPSNNKWQLISGDALALEELPYEINTKYIKNGASRKAADLSAGNWTWGTAVQQWDYSYGSTNQQWTITKLKTYSDGTVIFKITGSGDKNGWAWDTTGGSGSGGKIKISAFVENNSQFYWNIYMNRNGSFLFKDKYLNKFLGISDCANSGTKNGTQLQVKNKNEVCIGSFDDRQPDINWFIMSN